MCSLSCWPYRVQAVCTGFRERHGVDQSAAVAGTVHPADGRGTTVHGWPHGCAVDRYSCTNCRLRPVVGSPGNLSLCSDPDLCATYCSAAAVQSQLWPRKQARQHSIAIMIRTLLIGIRALSLLPELNWLSLRLLAPWLTPATRDSGVSLSRRSRRPQRLQACSHLQLLLRLLFLRAQDPSAQFLLPLLCVQRAVWRSSAVGPSPPTGCRVLCEEVVG